MRRKETPMPLYELRHLRHDRVVGIEPLRATSPQAAEAAALLRLRPGGGVTVHDDGREIARLPKR